MGDEPVVVETVLVPVDGSDESVRAAEFAIAIADRYDAGLHVLYVLGEGAVRGIGAGLVEADALAAESQSVIDPIEDAAIGAGVPVTNSMAYGFSPRRKLIHPGSVVLDAAEDIAADFIVLPREPIRGEPDEVLEKAAEYVLLYASQPVLAV